MNGLLKGRPALQYCSKVILPIYSPRRCMCTSVLLCKRLTDACLISVARSVKTAPRSLCTDIRCGSVDTSFCVCFFNGLIFHFPAKENTITQSSESRRAVLLAGDSSSSSGLWFNYPNAPHKLSFSSFPQTVSEELSFFFSHAHSAALKAFCAIGHQRCLWDRGRSWVRAHRCISYMPASEKCCVSAANILFCFADKIILFVSPSSVLRMNRTQGHGLSGSQS